MIHTRCRCQHAYVQRLQNYTADVYLWLSYDGTISFEKQSSDKNIELVKPGQNSFQQACSQTQGSFLIHLVQSLILEIFFLNSIRLWVRMNCSTGEFHYIDNMKSGCTCCLLFELANQIQCFVSTTCIKNTLITWDACLTPCPSENTPDWFY